MLNFSALVRREIGRVIRNRKYEETPNGILMPGGLTFGGTFGSKASANDPWLWGPNAISNEFINAALNCMFNNGAQPTGWFLAPFLNNLTPTSALTAATFNSVQAEYTSYTQSTRQAWTSNGSSTAQSVSNTSAPATFTIGSGSPVTLYGAGLLTISGKGATTGVLGAAGLFATPNTLNPGSQLLVTYQLTATSA